MSDVLLDVVIRRGDRLTYERTGDTFATALRDIYRGDTLMRDDFDIPDEQPEAGDPVPNTVMRVDPLGIFAVNVNGAWRNLREVH